MAAGDDSEIRKTGQDVGVKSKINPYYTTSGINLASIDGHHLWLGCSAGGHIDVFSGDVDTQELLIAHS